MRKLLCATFVLFIAFSSAKGQKPTPKIYRCINQKVMNAYGVPARDAKITIYKAVSRGGANWFPLQLTKLADSRMTNDQFKFDFLVSLPDADLNAMVYVIESQDYGTIAGSITDLMEPNKPIILSTGENISGQVIDETGNPIADATVAAVIIRPELNDDQIFGCSSIEQFLSKTNYLGQFEIRNISRNCDVVLMSQKEGWITASTCGDILWMKQTSNFLLTRKDIKLVMRKAKAKIEGKVFDGDTGKPVKGAYISLSDPYIKDFRYTDDNGHYEFACDPCSYKIDGFFHNKDINCPQGFICTDSRTITVQEGKSFNANLHFMSAGMLKVTGTTVDQIDANDFRLIIENLATGVKTSHVFIKQNVFDRISHGKYRIVNAIRPGFRYKSGPGEFTIETGKVTKCKFVFEKDAIAGTVKDKNGRGLAGVDIYVVPGSYPVIVSNPDGSFSIPAEYIGEVQKSANFQPRLIVAADSERNLGAIVSIKPDEGSLQIILQNSATVMGNIVDEKGAPIPDANVWVSYNLFGDRYIDVVPRGDFKTDIKGFYNIAGIPAGSYQLKVDKAGFAESMRNLYVENEPNGHCRITQPCETIKDKNGALAILHGTDKIELEIITLAVPDKIIEGQIFDTCGNVCRNLKLYRMGDTTNPLAESDTQGRFHIPAAGKDQINITVYRDNDWLCNATIDASIAISTIIVNCNQMPAIPTKEGGLLEITVRDSETNELVKNAEIFISANGVANPVQLKTDLFGKAAVIVPDGQAFVSTRATRYSADAKRPMLVKGEITKIEFQIKSLTKISGKIVDTQQKPVKACKLSVLCPSGGATILVSDGDYEAFIGEKNLDQTKIVLFAISEDANEGLCHLLVNPLTPSVIQFTKTVKIYGKVFDANSQIHSNKNIWVFVNDRGRVADITSDANGNYSVILPRPDQGLSYIFGDNSTGINADDFTGQETINYDIKLE